MQTSMRTISLVVILLLGTTLSLKAQFFNKVMDRAKDKLSDKIEEKITEKLAEEIASRAFKPIDKAFEDAWQTDLPKDSTGQVDWDKVNESYAAMLNGLDKSAELPESYSFDYTLHVETKDVSGEKNKMDLLLSKDGNAFGIQENTGKSERQLIIIDYEKDIIAMYDTEEKTGQAIGNMIGASSVWVANNQEFAYPKLEKTGKSKKICGYSTSKYEGDSEDEKIECYLAEEFPIDWKESYAGFLTKFAGNQYNDQYQEINGMIMKSESTLLENNKKSKWEVKKVKDQQTTINNSDYSFKPITAQ